MFGVTSKRFRKLLQITFSWIARRYDEDKPTEAVMVATGLKKRTEESSGMEIVEVYKCELDEMKFDKSLVLRQFEEARQGFADAVMVSRSHGDKVAEVSFTAHHKYFDSIVVSHGGESVL